MPRLVLILVVMDDALVHSEKEAYDIVEKVLILVVMDDALVLLEEVDTNMLLVCLNPCFNG